MIQFFWIHRFETNASNIDYFIKAKLIYSMLIYHLEFLHVSIEVECEWLWAVYKMAPYVETLLYLDNLNCITHNHYLTLIYFFALPSMTIRATSIHISALFSFVISKNLKIFSMPHISYLGDYLSALTSAYTTSQNAFYSL